MYKFGLNLIKNHRFYCTKIEKIEHYTNRLVPDQPIRSKIDGNKLPQLTRIDADTIAHLERLSLVDCANKQGIRTLEDSIAFADQILQIDTTGITPLVTVLEDYPLQVYEDSGVDDNCRDDILKNATKTEEEYFVAPPGNIPLAAHLCLLHGFLSRLRHKHNLVTYQIESTGGLLYENLKNEWFNHIINHKDIPIFLSNNSISSTYDFVKDLCLERPPFGIIEYETINRSKIEDVYDLNAQQFNLDFHDFFPTRTLLKCWVFLLPSQSTQIFHQWQRERRIWWRKFSAMPGRYSLSDIRTVEDRQIVEIHANYEWKKHLVETICLKHPPPKQLTQAQLQVKHGKKNVLAECLISEICSSTLLLNYLCDTYDDTIYQNRSRELFRFHRKLAPYKISFAIPTGPKNIVDELRDLALYLSRQLKSNNISCLLLPSSSRWNLEQQWQQYDQMGVPYNVLLNENTLKNGILQLRSRETTLKEQVHVADLVNYVEQLFKNY